VSGLYTQLELQGDLYVSATNEAESVAVAAGVWLGGAQGMALCQNSGLGNMVNPLSSLAQPYRIPLVLGVSRRGWPIGTDEPQHGLMGRITPSLLSLLEVSTDTLSPDPRVAVEQLDTAVTHCDDRRSSALIIEKGVFGSAETATSSMTPVSPAGSRTARTGRVPVETLRGGERSSRGDLLAAYLSLPGDRVTVATTGYISRELYGLDDRDSHFYMAGSMGCATGIGVGLAMTGRRVAVLDGDGALLMHLGSLATVGRYVRTPFMHVVLDNGSHESTGGQRTNASNADFAEIAAACGYRAAWHCEGIDAVRTGLLEASRVQDGPVLLHCLVRPGQDAKLPRPEQPLADLALRLRSHLTASAPTAAL
jgi:phosphonopyruvate decarboxylase